MPIYALGDAVPDLPQDGPCWIAPGAQVIGRVRLERDTGIWFDAVLRGDNELIHIGEGSNVQDGAVVHTDPGCPTTIGRHCTVGHRAIVHGCTLGDLVLVGMGAIVMNGAVIGTESIVGAGALVTEGKVFAPRSLIVGSPARSIRSLDDAAVDGLRRSAAVYIANAARFARTLRAL